MIYVIFMGPLASLNHLLNFAAPALALAVLLTLGGRLFIQKTASAYSWWAQVAINFMVGCAVLAAGLVWLGRDGKMLTYAALVVACASSQWVLLRAWR